MPLIEANRCRKGGSQTLLGNRLRGNSPDTFRPGNLLLAARHPQGNEVWDRLAPQGVVVMHDTNEHPGPFAVFEAIDERLFDKTKHCTEGPDWGIATAVRRQKP